MAAIRAKGMINNLPVEEYLASGHSGCAGCGQALAARIALKAGGKNSIVVTATGCLEVFSTPYPLTAWKIPWIHGAFENAAAIASGIDRALKRLKKRDKINLLAFAGDGGTFDIGLQALSGAIERRHDFCYVCFDNGAYMNTGIQRSGATPKYAATTTSPAGKKVHGKTEPEKPLPLIIAAHSAYVATANIAYPQDFFKKVQRALEVKGPAYVEVFVPCPPGWRHPSNATIEIGKLAFNCRATPLYEVDKGLLKFTMEPSKIVPISQYLKTQGRFKHLSPEEIEDVQRYVDDRWERLKDLEDKRIRIY